MENNNQLNIKIEEVGEIIDEFFNKMTFNVEIEIGEIKDNVFPLMITTSSPQLLIGEHGRTLFEIQFLLSRILQREIGQKLFIDLDVNQYKEEKINNLKKIAQEIADQVAATKKEKLLHIMPAYERRIIHLTLAERDDIITESIGDEPERRVIIKPA